MKIAKKVVPLLLCLILFDNVMAMRPVPDTLQIPAYIQAISNPEELRRLLDNPDLKDKLAAYVRLGEIGGEAELPLLKEVFDSEPYFLGIEAIPGVKYYSLISIGKIGGPAAEEFLRDVVVALAPNIKAGTNSFTRADSLITIVAALEGLGEITTPSVGAFLDSVFNYVDNNWVVRSTANLEALKIELKKNNTLGTAADTARFMLEKWQSVPWVERQFSTAGVNPDYLIRDNLEALIYQYRGITLPYVAALEKEMSAENPKLGALKKLRERMEANPAEPKE